MARSPATPLRKALRRVKGEPQLVAPQDQTGGNGRAQKIPRHVFQTAEGREVHHLHGRSIEAFRSLNPDLSFTLFDRKARDSYMEENWGHHKIHSVYERAVFGQMRADVFRYCILFDQGGYYFDYNKGCSKQLTQLHPPEASALITAESNPELLFPDPHLAELLENPFNLYAQWGFGFSQGHPILKLAIERIVAIEPFFRDKIFQNPKKALLTLSATGLFTSVVRSFFINQGTEDVHQAGIDFNGHGIFRLRGAKILLNHPHHYSRVENSPIVVSPT